MILGVLLPLGESLSNYAKYGQDVRFVKYYLKSYCSKFEKVYLFSYENENYPDLPKNCVLVRPKNRLHRYLYGLMLPLIHSKEYRQCHVFRCFHPSAAIPTLTGKLFFGRKFVFNYNYDYQEWARIEGKSYLVPFLYLFQRLAFQFCDGVFVADEKMESYSEKFVERNKITIIRNGVDPTSFRPDHKIHQNKVKVVLSVGRLETQKNYGQLITAVSMLQGKPKLIIVGRGQLEKELRTQAEKLGVNLEIVDYVPNDKLPEIYNSADVYVQPSLMEAPVKTLLEAMSCASPCVATDVVGVRDLITHGQNGLLAKLNAADLAKKIEQMLSDNKKAKDMGLAARKLIINKYNLHKFIEKEIEYLLKL